MVAVNVNDDDAAVVEIAAAARTQKHDGGEAATAAARKGGGCCKVKKSTIAIALFGIGVLAAVIVWGVIRSANSSSAAMVANRTMSIPVQLRPTSILHIWLKTRSAEQSRPAHIELRNPEGNEFVLAQTRQHNEFEFHEVAPRMDGTGQLEWITGDTWVSYIYVYEPESVLELGIRPAFIANAARNPSVPEGYHFRPPIGWMNDPNGFSKIGPHYHLFYQHYPHSLKWSSMHWGHAVSRDLLNWVHLPEFLLPDPSVALDHDGQGGIFSGSAITMAMPAALRIFYTDSLGARSPKEFQRMVTSFDGIHPYGRAQTIIQEGPPNLNLTQDFRDPNVIIGPDGKLKMLLGSKDAQGGVILLYGTDDPQGIQGWHMLSVLHRDNHMNMSVAECSGIVPVGGDPRDPNTLWALVYARMDSTDPRTGRRDLSHAIVGNFDGINFRPVFEQELDFGTHAYAFQAFYGPDGTLAIAWLANWKFWDWKSKPDFPTAMTLPRRFLLSADRRALLTPPVDFVIAKLHERQLDDGTRLRAGQLVQLPNGTAEVRFTLLSSSNNNQQQQQQQLANNNDDQGQLHSAGTIRLEIVHPKLSPVGVEISPEGLEILPGYLSDPVQRLIAMGARPREVQVLLDTGSIEVFADGGRWAGTLRVPGVDKFTGVRLTGDTNLVANAQVIALRPAAFRGILQEPFPTMA